MRPFDSWMLNVGDYKAVRRIPVSYVSLTGEVLGQEFESSLERDLLYLLCWDDQVDWFQVQPLKIPYLLQGKQRSYTPDLLASFFGSDSGEGRRPILCEVKYKEDLRANWDDLYPKFKAATAFARSKGWVFKIFTEEKIRTSRLDNIKFLWSYKFSDTYPHHEELLLHRLNQLQSASVNELLSSCFHPDAITARGEALWAIWNLVARKAFLCDLSVPLSMNGTRFSLNPDFPAPF
jgi:hypothetical protein